ncbi:MAG TPA: DUF5107 domain-containing protein [Thermodesulfobacteriota bacterium]
MITLENGHLVLTIRPDLGGRIENLVDRRTGRTWLWHPDVYEPAPRTLPIGASFDDHWTGGLDEVFPNDAAGRFGGRNLVDHGELWSRPWTVLETSPYLVTMRLACRTVPVVVEKAIEVDPDRPEARLHYRLDHRGDAPLPFLFKLHAAVRVAAGDRILLPPCTVEPVTLDFSTIVGRAEPTPWPIAHDAAGEPVRLDLVPPREANAQEFLYASGLGDGFCGVEDGRGNGELLFRFDLAAFPCVWLFQSYGRWRGHYVVVLEPATTMPYDLHEALARGTCAVLEPGATRALDVAVSLTA